VTPCILVDRYQSFRKNAASILNVQASLKMEAPDPPNKFVTIYQTIRRHIISHVLAILPSSVDPLETSLVVRTAFSLLFLPMSQFLLKSETECQEEK
jgi:hypothetical protein